MPSAWTLFLEPTTYPLRAALALRMHSPESSHPPARPGGCPVTMRGAGGLLAGATREVYGGAGSRCREWQMREDTVQMGADTGSILRMGKVSFSKMEKVFEVLSKIPKIGGPSWRKTSVFCIFEIFDVIPSCLASGSTFSRLGHHGAPTGSQFIWHRDLIFDATGNVKKLGPACYRDPGRTSAHLVQHLRPNNVFDIPENVKICLRT
ncbi:hypothetical protein GGX14DRAFT_404686 [Mycena pura]|uniref:Uncharacterized protein n=1 Tax=Mycena pura TaxID=153505 RepID=A0AAD6Y391_9AGAR|nr:hypothetical protein GGX14DRAFT_404686 [Mycena pura]